MSEVLHSITEHDAYWLAAALQVGGSVRFDTYKGRSYPLLQIGDNNQDRIEKILDRYGGYKSHLGANHTPCWTVKGEDAVTLAQVIKPYSPLHQGMIGAFDRWITTNDLNRRLEIATKTPLSNWRLVPAEAFADLVRQPDFCAGIYDMRGLKTSTAHSDNQEGGWFIPEIHVNSQNGFLLKALQLEHKGRFRIKGFSAKKAGLAIDDVDIREFNSFIWIVGVRNAKKFFALIRDCLLLRQDEADAVINWQAADNKFLR